MAKTQTEKIAAPTAPSMDTWDWYAGQALASFENTWGLWNTRAPLIATAAAAIADAMMAERAKRRS